MSVANKQSCRNAVKRERRLRTSAHPVNLGNTYPTLVHQIEARPFFIIRRGGMDASWQWETFRTRCDAEQDCAEIHAVHLFLILNYRPLVQPAKL